MRSRAGETGFVSFPFRDDAFHRFEAYCQTKVGRARNEPLPDETPVDYRPLRQLNLSGFGTEHMPGLVHAVRELARGSCRCPAAAPDEVDIVHVRSTLGGQGGAGRCFALRAQALDEGWALRVVTATPPVPAWSPRWVPAPLSLEVLADLLVGASSGGEEEEESSCAVGGGGLVQRLWTEAAEAGLDPEDAVGTVVLSSFHYPTLYQAVARSGWGWSRRRLDLQ